MNIIVFPNFSKNKAFETTHNVCRNLINMGVDVYIDNHHKEALANDNICVFEDVDNIAKECDVMIAIGGDGTILEASEYASKYDKALLGINTGRLGFMASMEKEDLSALSRLISGDYVEEKRMMIDCEHISGNSSKTHTALNEIYLSKAYAGLMDYVVSIDNLVVSNTRADGLIISTPTGSTAYGLSVGGPIIHPTLECIQVAPICPHSLFARPMIFSADKTLTVHHYIRTGEDIYFTADGRDRVVVKAGDIINISKSKRFLRLIDITGSFFYNAVNNKLINPIK